MLMVQEYGALGPLQRQHLTHTHWLCDLAAQIVDNVLTYPGTGDYQIQELNAPLLLLACCSEGAIPPFCDALVYLLLLLSSHGLCISIP